VIFLDEIGEASSAIQAKLLAYLDDYMVRPRGWTEEPFFCPTLVVAATNRDLRKVKDFRPDLLARFTDIEQVPPLRERVESFPFILDCLLQNPAINPCGDIQEIGQTAYETLVAHPFKGNFRELETVLRGACHAAGKDGRDFICRQDIAI
jgi:DNA-binding NtrC family response regulator